MSTKTRTSHAEATEAKIAGQQLSIWDVMSSEEDAFIAAVKAIAPGKKFTPNTLRAALDAARVPDKSRAALMRAACTQGWCKPVMHEVEGTDQHVKVRSTGASAKGAYVGLYERLPGGVA
jgi:hypothetical protein